MSKGILAIVIVAAIIVGEILQWAAAAVAAALGISLVVGA